MSHPSFVEAFLERADWGANPRTVQAGYAVPLGQIAGGVLHHAAWVMPDYDRDGHLNGDVDDVRRYMQRMQTIRPDLGAEVPYSAGIFPGTRPDTCVIAVGRGPGRTGAHTAGLNSTRYGLFVPGNTDTDTPMSAGQVKGFRYVMALWCPHAHHPTIGHRQAPPYYSRGANLNATGCPGNQGIAQLPRLQPPFTIAEFTSSVPPLGDDMPLPPDRLVVDGRGRVLLVNGVTRTFTHVPSSDAERQIEALYRLDPERRLVINPDAKAGQALIDLGLITPA